MARESPVIFHSPFPVAAENDIEISLVFRDRISLRGSIRYRAFSPRRILVVAKGLRIDDLFLGGIRVRLIAFQKYFEGVSFVALAGI